MPNKAEQLAKTAPSNPSISQEDKKRLSDGMLQKLKTIPDKNQQVWYFACISAALDETHQDIEKALKLADRMFGTGYNTQKTSPSTDYSRTLGRLKQ